MHIVWRFRSPTTAERGYQAIWEHDSLIDPDLSSQTNITYESRIAQQMSIRCQVIHDGQKEASRIDLCLALARYGSYVSEFSSHIDGRFMRKADFERMLGAIDRQVAAVAQD